MKFYRVRRVEGDGVDVIAVTHQRLFIYVPTTGLWHLHKVLTGPFFYPEAYPERGISFERMDDGAEVGRTIMKMPRLNERVEWQRRQARKFRAQLARASEILTSAEAGLENHQLRGHRPIATPGLPELVKARRRHWTHLALYAADATHSAPFTAVKTAQTTDRFDPPLEAIREVDPVTRQTRVKIRASQIEAPPAHSTQEQGPAEQAAPAPENAAAASGGIERPSDWSGDPDGSLGTAVGLLRSRPATLGTSLLTSDSGR